LSELSLLGVGIVGSGIVRACGVPDAPWSIRHALVRDTTRVREALLPPACLTTDPAVALSGEGPVIEVLGGEQPAADLIAAALEAGRPVATANKMAIALHGPRLFALARERGVGLGIEACVGGGVPVIAALRQLAGGQRLTAIGGVVNGTTNAILSGIEAGQTYAEALADAQAAGFAEPDPSADVEGHDPAAKLTILVALAFGLRLDPTTVPRRPLADISPADLRWASGRGARVKYLARAILAEDGSLQATVEPTALLATDPLASPNGSGNAIRIEGPLIGATTLTGPGAGPAPTAGALLGDVALAVAGRTSLDYPAPDAPLVTPSAPRGPWVARLPAGADRAAFPADTRWETDGDDQIALIPDASAPTLAPLVRDLGGTCFRWDAGLLS
jgi:homoserine dehydrogenase